jgi:excisionase family DNA binding protein
VLELESPRPPQLLTCAQAAALLALSKRSVYNLIREGELTGIRIGAALRVDAADVARFVERHSQ